MKRKWFALAAAAVALAVAVTVGVVLPSYAQGPSWDRGGGGFPFAGGWYGWQAMAHPFGVGGSLLGTVAKALGMNATDLQAELQAGKSVADVAQEKNVSLDTVVNAVLADIKTNLTQALQAKPGAGGFFGFGRGFGFGMMGTANAPFLNTIAQALNMNVADLQTELRAGKSVADVAQEKNVSLDTVVNALTASLKDNLTQLLQTKPGTGGPFGFGRGFGFGMGTMMGGANSSFLSTIAQALGMNVTDLQTELQAGKSVADVAQEKNVSLDTVVNALLANIKTNLTQALQAKPGTGGMFGFGFGEGGMMRHFGRGGMMPHSGRGWFFGGRGMGPGAGQPNSPAPTPQPPATPQPGGASL